MYDIELHSGEKHELNIVLEQKQRKIIFKSQNFILTPVTKTVKYSEDENEKLAVQGGQQELFYSVQIGAFRNKRSGDEEYFRGSRFDFEMDNGNLYRYFIGKYLTKDEAQNKKNELKTFYKDSIVVSIKGEKVEPVN